MVTLRYPKGSHCPKCEEAKQYLTQKGLIDRIDRIVPAQPNDPAAEGSQLAAKHAVDIAPFFIVRDGAGEQVYRSVVKLTKQVLSA